jgi:hypothetical protein
MKLILLVALMCCIQQQPQNVFNVMTFTKVPSDMEGCGENLFLNKEDEKAERFIFYTDYGRALICINNKMILMPRGDKPNEKSTKFFSNKDYALVVRYGLKKFSGDEDYEIQSAIITIKYHSKVIWTKSVIGGGGC